MSALLNMTASTHGCRTGGPRPGGIPGGKNTERSRRRSGTCARSRRSQPDTRLHLKTDATARSELQLSHRQTKSSRTRVL